MDLTLILLLLFPMFYTHASTQELNCSCGYRDPDTLAVYTESLIAYFNETDTIDPDIFVPQNFANKVQHGWRAIFREGAQPQNLRITNDSGVWHANHSGNFEVQSLEFLTSVPTADHVVYGGNFQSLRQDIQFGTFRAGMKSAAQWTGGTALTWALHYNSSQSLQVDFMNMNKPEDAGTTNLVNGEWPAYTGDLVTNYTAINETGVNPWTEFVDIRTDWNETNVDFWIGSNRTRSITKKDRSLPLAGTAMQFKSWSTGDKTYMGGPPTNNATKSHVLYVRAFFNTTTMTAAQHYSFDERCADMPMCLTSDITLRGSSVVSPAAMVRWEYHVDRSAIRATAGFVAAACSTLGVLALVNIFLRRSPVRKIYRVVFNRRHRTSESSDAGSGDSSDRYLTLERSSPQGSGHATPLPGYDSGAQTPAPAYASQNASQTHVPSIDSGAQGLEGAITPLAQSNVPDDVDVLPRIPEHNPMPIEHVPQPLAAFKNTETKERKDGASTKITRLTIDPLTERLQPVIEHVHLPMKAEDKVEPVTGAPVTPARGLVQAASKKRIDYLAGLVAVACIGVTLRHFFQTFWPWIINGHGRTAHYPEVEKWAKIFIGAYLVTQLWIGPFFLTATRFLSTNYLRNGNLEDVAKKISRRAPRLFVPITIIFTLEYFLMEMGLTAALQQLPSVGYSTWPYVVPPPNFGVYINNLVQLAYLMPNAIPEVISHYCIGVLWTVPIQLQFTYVVLLGAVLVRAVKTPWKRACFYGFVITCGWYARVSLSFLVAEESYR